MMRGWEIQGNHANYICTQEQEKEQNKVDSRIIQELESYLVGLKEGRLRTYKFNKVSLCDEDFFSISAQFEKVK